MKNFKYEPSVRDNIQTLVHKMYDAVVLGGSYELFLRQLSFELDMDDDTVDEMFLRYIGLPDNIYDSLSNLVNHLNYIYLEEN